MRLELIAEAENLRVTRSAIESIVYFAEGDLRKAINILQASASTTEEITDNSIYEIVSKAKPQDVRKIVKMALNGDFLGSRNLLREVMLIQGTSGEDMITQIYQEVSRMSMESLIENNVYAVSYTHLRAHET